MKIGGVLVLFLIMSLPISLIFSHDGTNTPPPPQPEASELFPWSLACKYAHIAPGPSWRGIEIGVTTYEELKSLFPVDDFPQIDRNKPYSEIGLAYNEPHSLPFHLRICFVDETVAALFFWAGIRVEPVYLSDLLLWYGEPDAVTYDNSVSRIVFWFQQGIAANVYTRANVPDFGLVSLVYLYPYQTTEDYETRWPYKYTYTDAVQTNDSNLPIEQNPFNFARIFGTLTAEPKQTLTPIPTIPITRPTATPGAATSQPK